MNWEKLFEDFRISRWPGFRDTIQVVQDNCYHSDIKQKDILVITAGDSWTWGDSLDRDLRLQQIYGHKIRQTLQADWINIGLCGWSNSWILDHAIFATKKLEQNSYKKIYLVVTLTESGRDVESASSYLYDYILTKNEVGVCGALYDRYLSDMESFWIKQINEIVEIAPANLKLFVGYNFVWHHRMQDYLNANNIDTTEKNWIEVLSDYQMMDRPPRTNLVCGWIFDTLQKINKIAGISDDTVFKEWAIPFIDKANDVNAWLDSSPMNYKKASKHPNSEAHTIWAEHILKSIT
jgi:hypothetical protein